MLELMRAPYRSLLVATALTVSFCGVAKGADAPSMRDVLTASYGVRDLRGVELAPDGRTVAWEEDFHDPSRLLQSPVYSSVYVGHVASGSAPIRITAGSGGGNVKEENPVWSPDGGKVAFLSDARSKGQLQLYIAGAHGRNVRELAHFTGDVQRLTWSPNGNALAVLYIPGAQRLAGAVAPGARDVGVIGSTVEEQRLATIDSASGAMRYVTPADVYVYEYGWSPDGREIAATYAKGNGDDNWWIARLARVDVATATMHDLLVPSYQIDDPQWSPDGTRIAIIGGIMSDFGPVGGDVYLVDARSGESRDVTEGAPVSAESLRWNDASSLDLIAHVSGSMRLMRLDVTNGTSSLTSLTDREESLWSWSTAGGGATIALVRATFSEPPEVWAGPLASLRRISSSNAGAVRLYGKAVSLQSADDGLSVQGWLVYPLKYDPAKRYPMVTMIHGGPSSATVPSFGGRNLSALASQGYFVFMPNPRGSYGHGEAFTRANIKDFGYGDWRDDLSGVDAAIKAAPIDPNRLGLMGWSYGGYMGMWAETQTTRFKAIVAGAGIVNWQSYYGQNKIDQWMIPFFGASVYQDPAVYARSSPITFITQSKTPVLILQGERDEEVPAPQAFEFWHAMETLGVPTKLIVYADEGHGPRKIVNQIDVLVQTVQWFDRFLGE
jgi:dipeptidyl aminopeptidase/acylaminoacyl peptidase